MNFIYNSIAGSFRICLQQKFSFRYSALSRYFQTTHTHNHNMFVCSMCAQIVCARAKNCTHKKNHHRPKEGNLIRFLNTWRTNNWRSTHTRITHTETNIRQIRWNRRKDERHSDRELNTYIGYFWCARSVCVCVLCNGLFVIDQHVVQPSAHMQYRKMNNVISKWIEYVYMHKITENHYDLCG